MISFFSAEDSRRQYSGFLAIGIYCFVLISFAPASAQDPLAPCKDILSNGVFSSYSRNASGTRTQLFDYFLQHASYEEYEKTKNAGGSASVFVGPIGVGADGNYSSTEYSRRITSYRNKWNSWSQERQNEEVYIRSGDNTVVSAWIRCIEARTQERTGLTWSPNPLGNGRYRINVRWQPWYESKRNPQPQFDSDLSYNVEKIGSLPVEVAAGPPTPFSFKVTDTKKAACIVLDFPGFSSVEYFIPGICSDVDWDGSTRTLTVSGSYDVRITITNRYPETFLSAECTITIPKVLEAALDRAWPETKTDIPLTRRLSTGENAASKTFVIHPSGDEIKPDSRYTLTFVTTGARPRTGNPIVRDFEPQQNQEEPIVGCVGRVPLGTGSVPLVEIGWNPIEADVAAK